MNTGSSARQPTGWMAKRNRYEDICALLGGQAAVIADGGANFGTVTELFRKQYPHAVIHAFEPIPQLVANLRQKFAGDDKVIVHGQALGAAPGKATFQVTNNVVSSSLFSPADRLRKYHGEKVSVQQALEVEVTTLDVAVKVGQVDLIKLDLQGGELAALKGAGAEVLPKTKVVALEAMFVEVYDGQPLFADIDVFLRSAGFRLYNLYDLYTHEDGQILQGDMVYLNSLFFR
jgi:FkbM family methyltransferase